jgi:BirA family transcriptional regulator, biotin operon repressor / biotin---[acetyl-CoA-carboxylase] ligase
VIDIEQLIAETFVRSGEWHDELDSTNSRALDLAGRKPIATPFLVGATSQSAGRGRGSNRWWNAAGTLMFSVLFDMDERKLPQAEWPRFSLGTALSVAETIETFLPQVQVGLKWPNDVWVGERKVCGILIEQSERNAGRLVVGIGLNVNSRFTDAPPEIRDVATSLRDASGEQIAPQEILVRLLQRWDANVAAQRQGELDLARRWSRLCILRGRSVRLTSAVSERTGTCHGIAEDGGLLIESDGRIQCFYAGTVRRLD